MAGGPCWSRPRSQRRGFAPHPFPSGLGRQGAVWTLKNRRFPVRLFLIKGVGPLAVIATRIRPWADPSRDYGDPSPNDFTGTDPNLVEWPFF